MLEPFRSVTAELSGARPEQQVRNMTRKTDGGGNNGDGALCVKNRENVRLVRVVCRTPCTTVFIDFLMSFKQKKKK